MIQNGLNSDFLQSTIHAFTTVSKLEPLDEDRMAQSPSSHFDSDLLKSKCEPLDLHPMVPID